MMKQGLIPFESLSVLYVLGRFALTRTAIPRDLLPFVAPDMPRFHPWSVCAFGRREAACVTAAALLGGHARVGFENNLTLPTGARAASNGELVGAAVYALEAVGLATQIADGLREEIAAGMRLEGGGGPGELRLAPRYSVARRCWDVEGAPRPI
jgi:3-keto-5-aminohexanoate cleavage enzyme